MIESFRPPLAPPQSGEREGDNLHHPPPPPYDPNLPPPQEAPPRPTATSRWNTGANSFPHSYFRPPPDISLAALVMMRRYTVHGEDRVISVAVKEKKKRQPINLGCS